MAPFGVEIDQIGEDEAAVGQRAEGVEGGGEIGVVAVRLDLPAGAAMGEDVADLADRDQRPPSAGQDVEKRVVRRGRGKILAVAGAGEAVSGEPTKGRAMTRPMLQRIAQAARDAADLIEALQPEHLLMRGDLEHAVDRGVADGLAGADVLGAELVDDGGAGGVLVAENAGQGGLRGSGLASGRAGRPEQRSGK